VSRFSGLQVTAAVAVASFAAAGPTAAFAATPVKAGGKATAPGQVCKSLKVKGKKTPEQRAAYKACIQAAAKAKKQAAPAPAPEPAPAPTA
jgi:hypothetical protein